jgi:hypothetical protein
LGTQRKVSRQGAKPLLEKWINFKLIAVVSPFGESHESKALIPAFSRREKAQEEGEGKN